MKISEIIPLFLSEADVQPQSRIMYKQAIEKFFYWAHANRLKPENLKKADVIRYKTELQESNLTVASVKNYLTILRIFYKWASMNNISDDITYGVRSPRYDNAYKKYPLSSENVNDLLQSIDKNSKVGARDYAMISLMVYNGLRRIEVARCDIGDLENHDNKRGLYIRGKGRVGKDQYIILTDTTFQAIRNYLRFRENVTDQDPLIANKTGERISLVMISRIVKARLAEIGLSGKHYSCHSLRHTAACLLIQDEMSLHEIQLFMRHLSPSTTTLYTRLADEQIIKQNRAGKALERIILSAQKNPPVDKHTI